MDVEVELVDRDDAEDVEELVDGKGAGGEGEDSEEKEAERLVCFANRSRSSSGRGGETVATQQSTYKHERRRRGEGGTRHGGHESDAIALNLMEWVAKELQF